jgi:RNA polymerase sigma factor (sigma-70 family)
MIPDSELLRRYAEQGDEAAFAEVVGRHVDLVYSAALRLVGGDAHLAQDVAQGVFTALARWAARLARYVSIAGWLYTTTRCTAGNLRRGRHRRLAREQEAYAMNQPAQTSDINWAALQPVLDEAVCALAAADREAVLLRFFQNKSHREVGYALGLGEDAARKRVDRALEKLRAHFARRGVAVSAGVLAAEIGANSVQAAPVGITAKIINLSLAAPEAAVGNVFLKILFMTTKVKILIALVIILATASALYIGQRKGSEVSATSNTKLTLQKANANVEAPRLPPVVPVAANTSSSSSVHSITPPGVESVTSPPVVGMFLKQLDQLANSPPSNRDKGSIEGQVYTLLLALAHYEPALALSKVGLIDDPKTRGEATGQIYGHWLATQTQQGLAALAQLPDGKQTQAYYLQAFQTWARANSDDPPLAAAAALTLPPGPDQEQALQGAVTGWAYYNPSAVLNWAGGLQPANPAAMYDVVVAASDNAPNLAAQYVDKITDVSAQSKAIQNISVNMTKTDPTATLAWLDQVATGETYDNSVAKLISTVVVKNRTLASALMGQVTKPGVSDAVSDTLASSNWARVFPRDAAAWLQTLPESPARDAAIQKLDSSIGGSRPPH